MRTVRSVSLALAVAALGCSNSPTGACRYLVPNRGPDAVIVVVDSITGAPLADGATGTILGGGVSDSLIHSGVVGDSVLVHWNLTLDSLYTVTVNHPGYGAWSRSGLHITLGAACAGISPFQARARLQPSP